MPRYYLHLRIQGEMISDEEGFDLPDLPSATQEAVRGALSIMSADVKDGVLRLDQSIEVTDCGGRMLTSVRFADALQIVGTRDQLGRAATKSSER